MRKVHTPVLHAILVLALLLPGFSLALSHPPVAAAQAGGNTISGRVTDGSGGGVAGATVRAVLDAYRMYAPLVQTGSAGSRAGANPPSQGQNFYTGQTDANGYYALSNLPAGRYLVSADKVGTDFAPLAHTVISSSVQNPYDFHVTTIPTTYAAAANALTDSTTVQLISVSADGSTYTFSTETPELAQVDVGEIVIGGASVVAPEGFLRKVVSKQHDGSHLVLVTEPAALTDAFESLSVNAQQQLTVADIRSMTDIPGVRLIRTPSMPNAGDFQFAMDNAVLYDQDGNLSTTGDQIVANGTLSVSPHIQFRIRIEDATLKELYFTSSMSVQTGFTVSSRVSLDVPLYEHSFLPQPIVLAAIPVGPLILTPELDLIAGITGSVYTGVSASISHTSSFTAGLWHLNGQTQVLSAYENDFLFSPLSFTNGVSFKAFVGPKLSVKIYGVVGGYVKPVVALNVDISPSSNPWLTLKGGFEVSVGIAVTIPIINKDLLNIQLGAINFWTLLYSLSHTPPGAFSKASPGDGAANQPTSLTLDWADSSGAAGYAYCYDTTKDDACSNWVSTGTTSQAALSGLSANTTYYWQARATNGGGTTYANGSAAAGWAFTTSGGVVPGDTVLVPAGTFQMGCDPAHNGGYGCRSDELPLHTVYLDAYRIDRTEVTNAQYAGCVMGGGCTAPAFNYSNTRSSYYANPAYANYPVIHVNWSQADAYCRWAGKRLPTEAEWEKAARGASDTRAYPWGDGAPACALVNGYLGGYCVGDTSAVGSYPAGASPYGALDMAGNVWEWVNDWYSGSYYSSSPGSNPQGPASGTSRVVRGGRWLDIDCSLRAATRLYVYPAGRGDATGFRCVAAPGM